MKKTSWLASLSLAGILLFAPALAAQSFTDYNWRSEMTPLPEIPAEFADAPAIIIKNEIYNSGVFTGEMPYIEQLSVYRTQSHIKIQSQEALDEYKRVFVPRFKGKIGDYIQIKEYDIRIRKPDGKIIDLEIKKLPQVTLVEGEENYKQRDEYYIYDLPDLAIGDEIETVSVMESKFINPGSTVTLSQEYPVLSSKYVIAVPRTVSIKGIVSGMPAVTMSKNADQNIYTWEVKNLKALPEANATGTIVAYEKEVPYFEYEIDFSSLYAGDAIKIQNFRDIVAQYNDDYLVLTKNSSKKVTELYNEIFAGVTDNSNISRLIALNAFIAKEMQIVPTKELKKDAGIEDYLTLKKADDAGIMKIYLDFFKRYKIQHYIGFVKDRMSGPINFKFVSSTQISDFFLVGKIDENYYTVNGSSAINELPYTHQAVDLYLVDKTNPSNVDIQTINYGQHQYLGDLSENKAINRTVFNVNTQDNSVNIISSNTLSGQFSTMGRGGYVNAFKTDSLASAIEKSYKNAFKDKEISVTKANIEIYELDAPYPFKVTAEINAKEIFKKGENGEITVDLSEFMSHQIRAVENPEKRVLKYYLPYLGVDVQDLIFTFDKSIKDANISELNVPKIETKYGIYECRAVKLNDKTIHLQSRYTVKHPVAIPEDVKPEELLVIPAEEVKLLDQVNQGFYGVRKKNLVVKF